MNVVRQLLRTALPFASCVYTKIFEDECTLPARKRATATEARYLSFARHSGHLNPYNPIHGAAMGAREWCGWHVFHLRDPPSPQARVQEADLLNHGLPCKRASGAAKA